MEFKGTKGEWIKIGSGLLRAIKVNKEQIVVISGTNADSDAKLIAAAPELLKALQDIYNCQYDNTKSLSNLNGLISDSINVIKKATE